MNATTAVALLVKTPGDCSAPTGLAKVISERDAQIFERLSANAMAESLAACVRRFPERITPYWAVGGTDTTPATEGKDFPIVTQGTGGFAERLREVYLRLRENHRAVVIATTDSPELTAGVWLSAWRALQKPGSVIGPAVDGGFYLLGSNLELSESIWNHVALKGPTASHILAGELSRLGNCRWLPLLEDIEFPADLERLSRRLADYPALSRGLAQLLQWARQREEESKCN